MTSVLNRNFSTLALAACLLTCLAGVYGDAAAGNAGRSGMIVALGDSLTAGHGVAPQAAYPARLEKKLQAAGYDWQVINAGISGDTSRGALMRMDAVLRFKPDIVILEIGVNDDMQGIPPHAIKRNVEEIVRILQQNNSTVVLAGMRSLNGRRPDPAFAEIYPAVAREYGLIFIPFFLEHVAGNPGLNLYDGIHPTPEGYRIITKMIYPYVQKAIKGRIRVRQVR